MPKLDREDRVTPRLNLVTGTWQAVCGWCMKRSRPVRSYAEREAWLEIASTEGWAIWQPPPLGGDPPPPAYPICLVCAEHYATTGEMLSPNSRKRKHR